MVSANVIRFRDGKSKGFAFVEMDAEEAAKKAIETLNGQDYRGRKLVVAEARPHRPREGRSMGDYAPGSYRRGR